MTETTTDDRPAPATPAQEVDAKGRKVWRAGTLAYTTGGLVILFFWLLGGDFAFYLKERSVPKTLQLLLKQFHGSDLVNGVLVGSLPYLLSMVLSPIISYRSDRHRGRWGRRIPFLLAPTPLAVGSMVGLAFSPAIGRWVAQLTGVGADGAVIASLGAFWTIFEVCSCICNAVFVGLINDVVPREVIGRFFGLFRVFSLGAGMVFEYFLLGKVETYYAWVFVGIAAVYAVGFSLMCLRVREGDYGRVDPASPSPARATMAVEEASEEGTQPAPAGGGALGAVWGATRGYFRDCFSIPMYLWYFASVTAAFMAFAPINLFSTYFAQSVGMSMDRFGKYSALQYFVSLVQAYPLGWLADKIHPMRLVILACAMHGATTLLAFFFVRDASMFGIAHVVCGACAGWWLTAWSPLSPTLLPRAKFAQYASAMAICYSFGTMVMGPVTGWFFDLVHHDYHYMYVMASGFDLLAVGLSLVVYKYFKRYGGTRNYVAPE